MNDYVLTVLVLAGIYAIHRGGQDSFGHNAFAAIGFVVLPAILSFKPTGLFGSLVEE